MENQTAPTAQPRRNRKPLVFIVLLLAGFVGAWLYVDRDPTDLWVVNGLSIPVSVQVDGQTLALEAQSWQMIEPGGGEYEIVVSAGERELSRETVTIDGDHVMAVYNVLGAGWVVGDTIWYTQYGGPAGDRNWEMYAFDTFHDIDEESVHLRFRPIPRNASVSGDASRAYMRFVGATNSGDWSWRRTLAEGRTRRTPEQLAAFEATLREAMPEQFGAAGPAPTSPGSPAAPGVAPAGNVQSAPRAGGPPGTGGKSRR